MFTKIIILHNIECTGYCNARKVARTRKIELRSTSRLSSALIILPLIYLRLINIYVR